MVKKINCCECRRGCLIAVTIEGKDLSKEEIDMYFKLYYVGRKCPYCGVKVKDIEKNKP